MQPLAASVARTKQLFAGVPTWQLVGLSMVGSRRLWSPTGCKVKMNPGRKRLHLRAQMQ